MPYRAFLDVSSIYIPFDGNHGTHQRDSGGGGGGDVGTAYAMFTVTTVARQSSYNVTLCLFRLSFIPHRQAQKSATVSFGALL
jgi:hypothetical protein